MVGDGSAGPTSHLSKVVAQLSTFKKLARLMRQIMMDGISEMRNVVLIFFKRKVKSGAAHQRLQPPIFSSEILSKI